VAPRDPIIRFLLLAGGLYLGWYLLYELVLHPAGGLDRWLIESLVLLSGGALELLGETLLDEPGKADGFRTVGVQGGYPLWIGDSCNGASLFAVYLIFLLAYPGPWRHKLWFAPLGLGLIHLINAARIVALVLIARRNYDLLNFNHDYTFHVVVYGFTFLLWAIWVKRFAPRATPVPPA
jgi:exosortase/archaeosortase family protein